MFHKMLDAGDPDSLRLPVMDGPAEVWSLSMFRAKQNAPDSI
jgi:hypothetical protein